MSEKKTILIFGGSFDPPHIGHVETAKHLIKALSPQLTFIFPAGNPPHKSLSAGASAADRFKMSKLAFERLAPNVVISDRELIREGKSYTFDTLTHVKTLYPDAELFLYVGSDMLMGFEKWFRFRDIFEMCSIVTARRFSPDDEKSERAFTEKLRCFETEYKARIILADKAARIVSSTEIRCGLNALYDENNGARAAKGTHSDKLDAKKTTLLLTEEVFKYIMENSLYIWQS